jgi:hypothetical protein
MPTLRASGSDLLIETDLLAATIHTEGYVSGVGAGTLLDKTTGARDLGFGLDIADFLLEPLADEPGAPEPYHTGDAYHGGLVKRYVELPQICTQARRLPYELLAGDGFAGARLWYRYQQATYGRRPGSLWEQTLIFRDGLRHFFSTDRLTSANTVDALIFRLDMPGHLKHVAGDSFAQIYLSYQPLGATEPTTLLPSSSFIEDFPPDARNLYQRGACPLPERMIRAYQVNLEGRPSPWLAGMTLDPAAVHEAWCHQRGYVCFIEEIGGRRVQEGETFGAAYIVGWFDDIEDMHATYDAHRGASSISPITGLPI